jgi:diamine N-acetyltransferase
MPPTATATPRLRAATPDDALCLGVLATQVFLDTYATGGIRPTLAREVLSQFSTAQMQGQIARPDSHWWVAEIDVDGEPHLVGFVQLTWGTTQALVQAQRPSEVDRLYVQEPFTGLGLGHVLLRAAEQTALALGGDVVWLSPWVHNHRALAFYARQGYRDLGATWYRFEAEAHENRVLAKDLNDPATVAA